MPQPTNEQILAEEKKIEAEVKQEMAEIKAAERRTMTLVIGSLALVLIAAVGAVYFYYASTRIQIDDAQIQAPIIDLSATAPGVLQSVDVHEGDTVPANTVVAQVGTQEIVTKVAGLIVSVTNQIGKQVAPATPVVSMIDPTQLRVVGSIDENKGLTDIQVGEPAVFTVDAFGSKKFYGTVDEIAPTSEASGIVFNISDERQTQKFDVKVRFDLDSYPELKNGMSAKITIVKP